MSTTWAFVIVSFAYFEHQSFVQGYHGNWLIISGCILLLIMNDLHPNTYTVPGHQCYHTLAALELLKCQNFFATFDTVCLCLWLPW